MKKSMFVFGRRVAFHETDSMGVLHHSNHIKLFEEARVHWLRDRGLIDVHAPMGPFTFAVVEVQCQYMKTARFDDLLEVAVQGRIDGLRIIFDYAIWNLRTEQWIAKGLTHLVPLNEELRPVRLTEPIRLVFASEPRSESWPPPR